MTMTAPVLHVAVADANAREAIRTFWEDAGYEVVLDPSDDAADLAIVDEDEGDTVARYRRAGVPVVLVGSARGQDDGRAWATVTRPSELSAWLEVFDRLRGFTRARSCVGPGVAAVTERRHSNDPIHMRSRER